MLENDTAFLLGKYSRTNSGPLGGRLPSQPTLSHLHSLLNKHPEDQKVLRKATTKTDWRIRKHGGGKQKTINMDTDSLPMKAHGHHPGIRHNGHCEMHMHHLFLANYGENGDMLGAVMHPGNASA